MLNAPRKTKYKKVQKGHIPNRITSNTSGLNFGSFGIKSTTFGILTNNQLEAARKTIQKKLKKRGKLWVSVFTHLPKTKKPVEVRMGKGKGSVSSWITKVYPGTVLFEFDGVAQPLANEIYLEVSPKLSLKCKLLCY